MEERSHKGSFMLREPQGGAQTSGREGRRDSAGRRGGVLAHAPTEMRGVRQAVAAEALIAAVREAVEAARAHGLNAFYVAQKLTDELDRHMAYVEESAAIKVQALYRGMRGRRRQVQAEIQDSMALPESLRGLVAHAYGTAVCRHPVHFEHVAFSFGQEERVPVRMIGPSSLFELVVQILVGSYSEVASERAEAEALKFDFLLTSMSPLSALALSSTDRHVQGVPPHAEYFAYVYPVAELDHLRPEQFARLQHLEARAQLLIYGGYAYFDASFTIVALIALTGQGGALTFEGPYPLLDDAQRTLASLGRLQAVTLSFLDAMGARSSGWVNPDEFGMFGLGAQPAPLGAFAYTDALHGAGRGVYFRLVPGASTPKVTLTVAFPPSVNQLEAIPELPLDLPVDATIGEVMNYVAARRGLAKCKMILTRSGRTLRAHATLEQCGFAAGVKYRLAAWQKAPGALIERSADVVPPQRGLAEVAAALGHGLQKLTDGWPDPRRLRAERALLQAEDMQQSAAPTKTDAQLAEMQRRLAALEEQNKELQLKAANAGAGEMGEELEALARTTYVEKLTEVLEMRKAGKFDEHIFEEYNEALVQLGDADLSEIYQAFMLVYTGEETDETLAKLGIVLAPEDDVDEAVIGFCEMMSIKLGEIIDQPRHVRIAAHAAAKQRKADAEKARLAKLERDREMHARMGRLSGVAKQIYDANEPVWRLLERGEGDGSAARRFGRKAELRLLVMPASKLKALSAYEWQNMSTGALTCSELWGLVYAPPTSLGLCPPLLTARGATWQVRTPPGGDAQTGRLLQEHGAEEGGRHRPDAR